MSAAQWIGRRVSDVPFLFRALRHRNYRLFFVGQGISVIGTWMQGAALGWLIKDLAVEAHTSARFWLGLVPFVGQLPTSFLPLLTGVLADRFNRRTIMTVTQSLAMCQALALAALTFTGVIQIWQVMLLALALGLINSFDIPARQSFTVEMVEEPRDLGNAIALNSSLMNGARLIGPLIAGWLIAEVGTANCFLVNGLSFIAVIAALRMMTVKPREIPRDQKHVLHGLAEGFAYVRSSRPIRSVLLLIALTSFMGVSYGVLMPVVAEDVLHGNARTYGYLLSAAGLGALVAVAFLASRKSVRGLKTIIASAAGLFGTGLVLFSFSRTLSISLCLLMLTGFGMTLTMAASNTFLQAIVDDDKRGRVMSFWTICFMGMVPLGSLFTGSQAHWLNEWLGNGEMWALRIDGAIVLAGAIAFATRLPMLRRLTHPIYVAKKLLPEIALEGAAGPTSDAGEEALQPNPAMASPAPTDKPRGPDNGTCPDRD